MILTQISKRTILYVSLKELGFVYEKRGNKAIMIERDDIFSWRHKYMVQIKKFRLVEVISIAQQQLWDQERFSCRTFLLFEISY